MSSSLSNRILSIYKSRNIILEHLELLAYSVNDYNAFSINEIDAMFVNSQLDMLISHNTEDKKVYIKYYLFSKTVSKQIRPQILDTIIEDLYEIESVLTPKDTLIIIIDEEPNDTIISKLVYLYERTGIFVVIHNIKRLQFNLLNHVLCPSVAILDEKEMEELNISLNLKSNFNLLPEISRFDPMALVIMLRPGQIAKLMRTSSTALYTPYYRICV
jgi:DNA-directed RNA polymerase subunit H (RpoH/RPB5)